MRIVLSLFFIVCIVLSSWWLWNNNETLRCVVQRHMDSGDILTLEARYTAQQILDTYKDELVPDETYKVLRPQLVFYPYLLMEVKFVDEEQQTGEGVILWSLEDGEMVLNTDSWATTHGFEDCIGANATPTDFRVIHAIAENGGTMNRRELQMRLHVEGDVLDTWIDQVKKKYLIVGDAGDYRLHFQQPILDVMPRTYLSQWLVTKSYKHATKMPAKYSRHQIYKIAKAAFGSDFTIRSDREIFLPVYDIQIHNPDGTILASHWNALTGQRMTPSYLE